MRLEKRIRIKTRALAPQISHYVIRKKLASLRLGHKKKGIFIFFINAYKDHIHCLVLLKPEQNIAKVVQMIKGESSFWIKKNKIGNSFEWSDEYFAVSVSESMDERVKEYIRDQELHHQKKSWGEEYQEFLKNYNFGNY